MLSEQPGTDLFYPSNKGSETGPGYTWFGNQLMNFNLEKQPARAPLRNWIIRAGIALLVAGSLYLTFGLLGWFPLELETIAWNNIRIVSGVAIAGCLMAAFGYGDE